MNLPKQNGPDWVDPNIFETNDDKLKAENILRVTKALRKIYLDKRVVAEVAAAISTGYYSDERVLLKDLLTPQLSPIYSMKVFQDAARRGNFTPGLFKSAFEHELKIEINPAAKTNTDYFFDNGLNIYFPYSEYHVNNFSDVAVVPATIEADEAYIYFLQVICPDAGTLEGCYTVEQVRLINDDYAVQNPVHVVGISPPVVAQNGNTNCAGSLRIQVGMVKVLGYQYDKLFSTYNDGGSELRLGVIQASVSGAPVNQFVRVIPLNMSRAAIREQRWEAFFATAVPSWPGGYPELGFGMYEFDITNDSRTVSGSIRYNPHPGYDVSSAYSISVPTQHRHSIVDNKKHSRSWFLSTQTQFGHTVEFQQGYGPQFLSTDGFVRYSFPISCF